ncbi:MAG: oligosaccharide flippase family protein, partial [Firmicutes bacterium]|nr:oligosaccharide flippase family protein [Bacillota bacterium]
RLDNKNDPTLCKCTITLLVCLLGYVVQQNWFFQGMNEMKYISVVNIIGRTVSTVLIFLLVKKPDDIVIYSLLYSVSPLLSGFVGICIVTGKFKIKFAFPSFSDMKKEFAAGFYVFTTSLSAKVFGAIGVTILGAMYASDIVGAFSAIQKIPNIVILMWTPISQIMYPIASRKNGESIKDGISFVRKVSGIILPLFAAGSLLMAVFSKQIVYIAFGEEYVQYSYWLIFLVIWMFFGIVNNFLGIQILLASGHDKEYSKCFQIGVAATVIINYIFISQIGGTGAAAAPAFSEILITVLLLIQVKKVMSL